MKMPFVHCNSIVRKIWGNADTVLLVFAGSAAEFPLNKAVDWLYYTGRLPSDPLGRLFSTVQYAQQIVFANYDDALAAIDKITAIHKAVEASRKDRIPDTAYLDVLFMLIDYSIRSAELLGHKLTEEEKREIFDVFHRVGARMGLIGLPNNYSHWRRMRAGYLRTNLVRSTYTHDLYRQYRRHLGAFRYYLLRQVQTLLVPKRVRQLLSLPRLPLFYPVVWLYKVSRWLKFDRLIKALLLPSAYKIQIAGLDKS
ncbi:MAG TPA: oxygenase MpaB family protein [Puia sp.]|nr:oxygenase MpaB family protein [Puia sp.]